MKMIDRVIRSMQDTGLIDGMSMEDCDTLATAVLEGMREIPEKYKYSVRGFGPSIVSDAWTGVIDAALKE